MSRERGREILDFSPLRIGARLPVLGVACLDDQQAQEGKAEDGFERWHVRGALIRRSTTVTIDMGKVEYVTRPTKD